MLRDVEDILDCWENTGLLKECTDPFNYALILETQRRVNKKYDAQEPFASIAITAALNALRQKEDCFQGLIEFSSCRDVYRLGWLPNGPDVDVCEQLVLRILQLPENCLYYGGLVLQNNRVYLIADPVD